MRSGMSWMNIIWTTTRRERIFVLLSLSLFSPGGLKLLVRIKVKVKMFRKEMKSEWLSCAFSTNHHSPSHTKHNPCHVSSRHIIITIFHPIPIHSTVFKWYASRVQISTWISPYDLCLVTFGPGSWTRWTWQSFLYKASGNVFVGFSLCYNFCIVYYNGLKFHRFATQEYLFKMKMHETTAFPRNIRTEIFILDFILISWYFHLISFMILVKINIMYFYLNN